MTRPLRLLIIHPGATWSTADVFDGLTYGLKHHGVEVIDWRLDVRIEAARRSLNATARIARKANPEYPKPTKADVFYQAALGSVTAALRHQVDAVIVVSAMFFHPDVLVLMKRAGLKVFVLLTESPYDHAKELAVAQIVDGVWTNERSMVAEFLKVTPYAGYLPHGWHPEKHKPGLLPGDENVPAHDVVFVGSGFMERITWFNKIDWTGINLGLYGTWKDFGLKESLLPCVKAEQVDNAYAAALYRRCKVGLNLYRIYTGWATPGERPEKVTGESLSPRAYELAQCGVFHLSAYRTEVREVFGDLVPTFESPQEAEALIRRWVADDEGRARVAAQLPACVAEASWVERSTRVLGDLQSLLQIQAA